MHRLSNHRCLRILKPSQNRRGQMARFVHRQRRKEANYANRRVVDLTIRTVGVKHMDRPLLAEHRLGVTCDVLEHPFVACLGWRANLEPVIRVSNDAFPAPERTSGLKFCVDQCSGFSVTERDCHDRPESANGFYYDDVSQ